MRIVVLGMEEFIPGEACRTPCPLDQLRQPSNRPLEDWGKLLGDALGASGILDRFLHRAELVQMTGRSYRLRQQTAPSLDVVDDSKPAIAPSGSGSKTPSSKPAIAPSGSGEV
jgi:hypothetical protein